MKRFYILAICLLFVTACGPSSEKLPDEAAKYVEKQVETNRGVRYEGIREAQRNDILVYVTDEMSLLIPELGKGKAYYVVGKNLLEGQRIFVTEIPFDMSKAGEEFARFEGWCVLAKGYYSESQPEIYYWYYISQLDIGENHLNNRKNWSSGDYQ